MPLYNTEENYLVRDRGSSIIWFSAICDIKHLSAWPAKQRTPETFKHIVVLRL